MRRSTQLATSVIVSTTTVTFSTSVGLLKRATVFLLVNDKVVTAFVAREARSRLFFMTTQRDLNSKLILPLGTYSWHLQH